MKFLHSSIDLDDIAYGTPATWINRSAEARGLVEHIPATVLAVDRQGNRFRIRSREDRNGSERLFFLDLEDDNPLFREWPMCGVFNLFIGQRPEAVEESRPPPIEREPPDIRAQREVFARLLEELPRDRVMFRTMSNVTHTAGELLDSLRAGGDLGRQYASDVLRIARDLLSRKAASEPAASPKAKAKNGELYRTEMFCDYCQTDTDHEVVEFGHERDNSSDSRTCLNCGSRWLGFTGRYSPPDTTE